MNCEEHLKWCKERALEENMSIEVLKEALGRLQNKLLTSDIDLDDTDL